MILVGHGIPNTFPKTLASPTSHPENTGLKTHTEGTSGMQQEALIPGTGRIKVSCGRFLCHLFAAKHPHGFGVWPMFEQGSLLRMLLYSSCQ